MTSKKRKLYYAKMHGGHVSAQSGGASEVSVGPDRHGREVLRVRTKVGFWRKMFRVVPLNMPVLAGMYDLMDADELGGDRQGKCMASDIIEVRRFGRTLFGGLLCRSTFILMRDDAVAGDFTNYSHYQANACLLMAEGRLRATRWRDFFLGLIFLAGALSLTPSAYNGVSGGVEFVVDGSTVEAVAALVEAII